MQNLIRYFFAGLGMLVLWGLPVAYAQHAASQATRTPHVFEAIDQAFQKGRLTLDQKVLYQLYTVRDPDKLPRELRSKLDVPIKCGTPAVLDYHRHRDQLQPSTISEAETRQKASLSVQAEETYTSPDGKFSIHYSTSGEDSVSVTDTNTNGIPDYVEWVAEAADSSWRHQVDRLGYSDPVTGNTDPYPVYIENTNGFYGYTDYGDNRGFTNSTYIVINSKLDDPAFHQNDDDNKTQGAIKVTVAHELKHAIQYAATAWQGESDLWTEMDATLMEEVVYDNVNDYYNYIHTPNSIFNNPRSSFYPGSYYHVTWALFFEEKYGSSFWVNVWGALTEDPDLPLITAMRRELGGDTAFQNAFTESHLWHFASGTEYSSSNFGFEERLNYPDPFVEDNGNFYSANFSIPRESVNTTSLDGFTATYFKLTPPANATGKVLLEISGHDDHAGTGIIAYFDDGTTESRIYTYAEQENTSFDKPRWNWNNIQHIGLVLTNTSTDTTTQSALVKIGSEAFNQVTLTHNYPNPFRDDTRIRFTISNETRVKLNIYNIAGQLVRTVRDEEMQTGMYEEVVSMDNLASGIYFYRLTTDEESITRKMTLIK